MASVLIVGINYRPETSGIAPYTTAVAEHLAESGHRTTVVTGFPHYPAWRLERGERRLRATERLAGVRVLRRRHYVPGSQSALRRAVYEATFLLNGALARPGQLDAVFGIVPSLSGGMLARYFAARAGAPYALIMQDLMGPAAGQSGIRGGGGVVRATEALERWMAEAATVVAPVSDTFRPYLHRLGVADDRMFLLPNWAHVGPSTGDRTRTRARLRWSADATVVLHAGNMGLKQGLEQIVAAARRADELEAPVLFVLMGDGSQRASLETAAAGIARIRFVPFQSEAELPDVLEAADVLLLSERPTVIDMSLPSKLTTYLATGRPILAAVPDGGATAREVRISGGGEVVQVGDPDALNRAVADLRSDRARADALGRAGQAYSEQSLGASQALARIDELLERTMTTPPTRRG